MRPATAARALCSLLILCLPAAAAPPALVDAALAAVAEGRPWPRLTAARPGAGLAAARAVQRRLVARQLAGAAPAGFKAALTSAALRARFGADSPLLGVLPPAAQRPAGEVVTVAAARRPMLELELCWRLAAEVEAVPGDDPALLALVDGVLPCVEIPAIAFAGQQAPQAADILAMNTAVLAFVTGRALPADRAGSLELALRRGDTVIARGRAGAIEGGQLQALRRLLHQALAEGWRLRAGQLLLTGALNRLVPAAPGAYRLLAGGDAVLAFRIAVNAAHAGRGVASRPPMALDTPIVSPSPVPGGSSQ